MLNETELKRLRRETLVLAQAHKKTYYLINQNGAYRKVPADGCAFDFEDGKTELTFIGFKTADVRKLIKWGTIDA